MALIFWDASALAKRYTIEQGREVVNYLFDNVPFSLMACTTIGYAETYSILVRRLNGGILNQSTFNTAVLALQSEIVDNADFRLLTVTDVAIFNSIRLMRKHNINATDSAILTVAIDLQARMKTSHCVLVSSDKRLLRSALPENLCTLNPEDISVLEVPALLNSF